MTCRPFYLRLVLTGAVFGVCLFATQLASAQLVYLVDSTADAPDAIVNDGICATAEGSCTLRAALQESQSDPGGTLAFEVRVPPGVYEVSLDQPSPSPLLAFAPGGTLSIVGWQQGQPVPAEQRPVIIAGPDFPRHLLSLSLGANTQEILLRDLVFTGAHATDWSGNLPDNGGAIGMRCVDSGTVRLERVRAEGNSTSGVGAALYNEGCDLELVDTEITGNCGRGGAVSSSGTNATWTANVTVLSSSITDNSPACLPGSPQFRGMRLVTQRVGQAWSVLIENSTISGNRGALAIDVPPGAPSNLRTVVLRNVTMHNKSLDYEGYDAVVAYGDVEVQVSHATLGVVGGLVAANARLSSLGYSRIPMTAEGGGQITVAPTDLAPSSDAMLGPLGPAAPYTRAHTPLFGSPLVDAGAASADSVSLGACAPFDQHGIARPMAAACDIGAIEGNLEAPPQIFADGFES